VREGNLVHAAGMTPLVVINQLHPIAVYFTLPESQLPQVLKRLNSDKRMPADAYDRSDTQLLTSGNLLTADNQIDTTTGTGKLKAVFDNKDGVLFPNQFVNIHLIVENRPSALVIPSAAIQTGLNGSLFVWTINDDGKGGQVAQMQPVNVALAEGQVSILNSGPAPGAKVVVDGADRLRPGQAVSVSASSHQHPAAAHGAGSGRSAAGLGDSTTLAQPDATDAGKVQNPSSNQRQHQ